jgi:hypothetical protein
MSKTVVQLQLMASADILQYIPPETLGMIQKKDDHPLFRAYIVGEEGNATPRIVGGGSKVLNWLRSAISTMVQKLQYGTKIFLNHGATNEHSGRTVVGELVGKALEYVGGKMQAIAVTYIYPQHRDVPADAASIEAEIEIDPSGRSNIVEGVHIQKITGIAVGDSRLVKTAFPAAGLISQLQAFETQGNENQGGNRMDLTIEQVRDFIMLRRLTPSEVFNEDAITRDTTVRSKIKAEFDMRERLQKEFDDLKKNGTDRVTKLETENKGLKQTIVTGKAQSISQAIIAERKMPENKAKFVALQMPKFAVEGDIVDDTAIKAQLNKFIDTQIDEFGKLEAVFTPGSGSTGGDNGKGKESGSDGKSGSDDLIKTV